MYSLNQSEMENKERAAIKAAILQGLSEEIDKWLDQEQNITSGYEYETAFIKVVRNMNKIVLEKSLGKLPGSRNSKKKSTPALGK